MYNVKSVKIKVSGSSVCKKYGYTLLKVKYTHVTVERGTYMLC